MDLHFRVGFKRKKGQFVGDGAESERFAVASAGGFGKELYPVIFQKLLCRIAGQSAAGKILQQQLIVKSVKKSQRTHFYAVKFHQIVIDVGTLQNFAERLRGAFCQRGNIVTGVDLIKTAAELQNPFKSDHYRAVVIAGIRQFRRPVVHAFEPYIAQCFPIRADVAVAVQLGGIVAVELFKPFLAELFDGF